MAKPTLAVVSGPPGTGKTTLAHALAEAIGCPAVCRDEIKEGMVHALGGAFEPAPGDALTQRTLGVFFGVVRFLLEAGVTVVAEAAFQDRVWRPQLAPLQDLATLKVIRCRADPSLARQRVAGRPVRTAHADSSIPRNDRHFEEFQAVSLPVATLDVDTGDGYSPPLSDIVAFLAAG